MKTGGILWYNAVITIRIGVKVMILVSAAIIRNTAGEILICQRGAGGSCAFYGSFRAVSRKRVKSCRLLST